jgi:phosphoglycolate phosphatase-like HAD superfamily hydrolase
LYAVSWISTQVDDVHLAVFDIDGTLVDSDEFDGRLYAEAIRTVLGLEIDRTWSTYNNVTDSGILNEILNEMGPPVGRREGAAARDAAGRHAPNASRGPNDRLTCRMQWYCFRIVAAIGSCCCI